MFHTPGDAILLRLLQTLEHRGYEFVCPGNPTIRLVRNRRRIARAGELRDVLGWSLPFIPGEFDPDVEALLVEAGAVRETAEGYQASFRCSRVQGTLLLHSAYPTKEMDSVFLGPDTYRFAEFLRNELNGSAPVQQVCDIGAGTGAGGIIAAQLTGARHAVMVDINPRALHLTGVNAAHAALSTTNRLGSGLEPCGEDLELVVSNPPFIADGGRLYSDGGDMLGAALPLAWSIDAMRRLRSGGRLMLYTGSAIVDGKDHFARALKHQAAKLDCHLTYRELDPDIFGDQLRRSVYAEAERIAAVGVVATKR